jgi:uncharacterized RDD family membrane protein YckC
MKPPVYVARKGKQLGPYPSEDIPSMLASGKIDQDDYFWCDGMADWRRLSEWQTQADAPAEVFSRVGGGAPIPPVSFGDHPGFIRRAAAHILDGIVIYFISFIGAVLLVALGMMDENIISLLGIFTAWLYYAFMESSSKQATLGKMALGFIVTDMSGQRISFLRASVRYFSMILSTLILFIGFLMCIFTRHKQCLHDMIAGCVMRTRI